MNEDYHQAKRNLISLYLTVKVRKENDVANITKELMKNEENALLHLPLNTIVEYIKSSIDAIITMKLEETVLFLNNPLMTDNANEATLYETLLRKEESEIRQHIKIENHLKLNLEKAIEDCEELAKEIAVLKNKTRISRNDTKDFLKQAATMSNEYRTMRTKLQKYEDQQLEFVSNRKRYSKQLLESDKVMKKSNENRNMNQRNKNKNQNSNSKNSRNIDKEKAKTIYSYNSSLNSASHSKRKSKSNSAYNSTNQKKHKDTPQKAPPIVLEKKEMAEKMQKYKNLTDKKSYNELTRNKNKTHQRLCQSISYLKERTFDNEFSIIVKRNEELTQRLNEATMKVLMNNDKKPPVMMIKKMNMLNLIKNLHLSKKPNCKGSAYLHKKTKSAIPIIISQPEIQVNHNINNNINFYSGHNDLLNNNNHINSNNTGQKTTNQVNLRQHIFSKCGSINIINKYRGNSKG